MARKNGWEKSKNLANSYCNKWGSVVDVDRKRVLMLARKWLIGFSDDLTSEDEEAFAEYVDNFSSGPFVKPSVSDTLNIDLLVAIGKLVVSAGSVDRFEQHFNAIKIIKNS